LSLTPLVLTLTLTLNPNSKDVTKPKSNPTDPTNPNQLTTNLSVPPQKIYSYKYWDTDGLPFWKNFAGDRHRMLFYPTAAL